MTSEFVLKASDTFNFFYIKSGNYPLKKTIGWGLLVLSYVAWGGIALLPFIDITKAQIAGATIFIIVACDLLFILSIYLLGKETWENVKAKFKRSE